MCSHLWTYRNNQSECIRCSATANDGRGLPHGYYAINGVPMTPQKLQQAYACPQCLADINPRIVDGQLRLLCVGMLAHDIEVLGRAMTKGRRDYLLQKQQQDYYTIFDGLPENLQKEILNAH